MSKKKPWLPIQDKDVVHIWANPDGTGETDIPPTFYEEAGTPVCDDDIGDTDMVYVRTEISPELAADIKFRARVEPVIRHIFDALYWDSELKCFDPAKQWDSAADFIEMIADQMGRLYKLPIGGTTEYPKLKRIE